MMTTLTSHVIASSRFLNKNFTFWASFPLSKSSLEIKVTASLMTRHHTFPTELFLTFLAFRRLQEHINYSFFALWGWTNIQIRIINRLSPQSLLPKLLLNFFWQFLEDIRFNRHCLLTALFRAQYLFININFINTVLAQAL